MTHLFRTRTGSSLRAVLLASTLGMGLLAGGAAAPVLAAVPAEGYADLVAKVMPSVVRIEVTQKAEAAAPGQGAGMPNPFDEFLRRFGEGAPGFAPPAAPDQAPQRGLGSGFIISAKGEIVTNNHVVEGASAIRVRLEDGRSFSAHVVGTDPLTDIALIALDNASDLPVATLAATDTLRVGDAVVAVGNPFGLGGTVTSGIVSAMGRNINSGPYDNYIQTDAAINRGNSGGPLFSTDGQVVGMNTAIFSPSGGSVGIGFSVPAQTINTVITQLRETGTVARGWLGVSIQPVTEELAEALGLPGPQGAIVAEVLPDSPALAAGLRSGDVILSVNDAKVEATQGLPTLIAAIPNGEAARLAVLRGAERISLDVTIGTLTPEKLQKASATVDESAPLETPLGVTVAPLDAEAAAALGLGTGGVVVSTVDPGSLNADRILPGDVITEAAGKPVDSTAALLAAIRGESGKTALLLKISREGKPLFVGAAIATS